MSITPDQCRAARSLIQWSRKMLAKEAGITERTITDFERRAIDANGETRIPRKATLLAMKSTLENAGVRFINENGDGPGVRLRRVIWKLTPIDPENLNWEASTYCGDVFIRAATEERARSIATGAFWRAVERKGTSQSTILNPWGRPVGEVECTHVINSEFREDGPDEILFPAEYNLEWPR